MGFSDYCNQYITEPFVNLAYTKIVTFKHSCFVNFLYLPHSQIHADNYVLTLVIASSILLVANFICKSDYFILAI